MDSCFRHPFQCDERLNSGMSQFDWRLEICGLALQELIMQHNNLTTRPKKEKAAKQPFLRNIERRNQQDFGAHLVPWSVPVHAQVMAPLVIVGVIIAVNPCTKVLVGAAAFMVPVSTPLASAAAILEYFPAATKVVGFEAVQEPFALHASATRVFCPSNRTNTSET